MNQGPSVSLILLLSGITTLVIGIVLVAAMDAWWPWLVVALGLSDLFIAAVMSSSARRRQPSENPYARED